MLNRREQSLLDCDFLSAEWTNAVYEGHNDLVQKLLDAGISPDQPLDRRMVLPLASIADIIAPSDHQMFRHRDTVRLLIKRGASLHTPNIPGFLPAHLAMFSGNSGVAVEIVTATLRKELIKGITTPLRPKISEYFAISIPGTYRKQVYANLVRNMNAIAHAVSNDSILIAMNDKDRDIWTRPFIPVYQNLPKPSEALRSQFARICALYKEAGSDLLENDPAHQERLDAELDRLQHLERVHLQLYP